MGATQPVTGRSLPGGGQTGPDLCATVAVAILSMMGSGFFCSQASCV